MQIISRMITCTYVRLGVFQVVFVIIWGGRKNTKYRYQAIKKKEQSKLKIQKTRLSHEIRRHENV